MAQQPQRARETIAKDRRANVADVHWLGDVRRTEINDDGARLFRLLDKGMFGADGGLERLRQRRSLEAKIDEAHAGQLHFFAPLPDVQPGQYIGRELPRAQLALFGE